LFLRGLGAPQDATRAEGLLAKACDKGSARACSKLAPLAFQNGELDRADRLASRACDLGDPSACSFLGDTYARSNDMVRAILFFKRACDAGFAHGCAGQGYLLLESGADPEKARRLLRTGCAGGDEKACEAVRGLK